MSESLYECVFAAAPAGIAVHDGTSPRFEAVNEAYAEALGCDPTALAGRSLTDLAVEDAAGLSAALDRARDGAHDGPREHVETRLEGADGCQVRVTLAFRTARLEGERRLLSSLRPVETRPADGTSSTSERRLEVALAGTGAGVWEWDIATDEVLWTESMERLFGLEPGAFDGTFEGFAERVHPEDLPEVEAAIEEAIETGEMFQTEYRIEREDGAERWVDARGELQESADGPGRIIGIVTDVTERRCRQEALRRQERQYRHLVERLPDAHYVVDDEWQVTFCNEALAERLDRPVEEIEGEQFLDLLPADDSVVRRVFDRVMDTGDPETFEYRYGVDDRVVRIQAYPAEGGVAAVSTDVTEQRQAFQQVLDATPIVLYRIDAEGVFQEARGQILSRLGLEPDDLVGESIFEAYADNEEVVAAARRALSGESFRYTVTLDGLTLETNYTPVYEDGEVTGVIGVSMDVTELHRQRERMEFFNSILRHDVLNGMTVIKMRAELLADQLEGEQAQYARTIAEWCDSTTEVTKRVRRVVETLATPDEEHRLEPVDVSAVLQRKVRELGDAFPAVTFETAVPDGVHVEADELLADVLGNVLTNSIEHNDDGLTIETSVDPCGDTVRIVVSDDGVGVPDDRKESVFRRGETSHAKETGSGFGLFFVEVMVEKYGGDVWVDDSDGGGARFVVELAREDVGR